MNGNSGNFRFSTVAKSQKSLYERTVVRVLLADWTVSLNLSSLHFMPPSIPSMNTVNSGGSKT
jgi:hypothetical protein